MGIANYMIILGKSKSIISFLPPELIPVIIIIISIVALTIIIERSIYFFRMKSISPEELRKIKELLREERWNEAKDFLDSLSKSPASKVLQVGVEYKNRGSLHIEDEMETEGYRQIFLLEKFLTGLGTIATISPLLGVLGTVTGIIRSFSEGLGTKGAEIGISEALITTAMGLSVSIPSYIFYNYLVRKKEERVTEMENISNQALQILAKNTKNL